MTCERCGATLSPAITWCGQCHRPLVPRRAQIIGREARPTVVRASPTTFGIAGRLLVTAIAVAIGVALNASSVAWGEAVGPAGEALRFVIMGLWAIAAVPVLLSTWRRGHRTRVVYVDGPLVGYAPVRLRGEDPTPG